MKLTACCKFKGTKDRLKPAFTKKIGFDFFTSRVLLMIQIQFQRGMYIYLFIYLFDRLFFDIIDRFRINFMANANGKIYL